MQCNKSTPRGGLLFALCSPGILLSSASVYSANHAKTNNINNNDNNNDVDDDDDDDDDNNDNEEEEEDYYDNVVVVVVDDDASADGDKNIVKTIRHAF